MYFYFHDCEFFFIIYENYSFLQIFLIYLDLYRWLPCCSMDFGKQKINLRNNLIFIIFFSQKIGELYPMKVRGLVGGMTTMMAHTFVFLVVKTYPKLAMLVERHGAFLIYGCISVIGTIFFYFFLPETKGRTLQEIEDYFSGRISSLDIKKSEKVPTNNNNNNISNNLNNNNNNQIILTMENEKLLNEKL